MAGRPRNFESVEDLDAAIEEYFNGDKHFTITGLALHLGFESRQSFYDYEKNEQFSYAIKRARLRVENYYEGKLMSKESTGAIFALKQFHWKDKTETDLNVSVVNWNEIKSYEPD